MSSLSERAQAAQESLFGRYDRLNEKINLAEERLTSHHIPYTVAVWSEGQYATDYYAVAKIKGEWRLCYGTAPTAPPNESEEWPEEWKPLVECSAITRINAVKHLGRLETKLVERSEQLIPHVDDAIAELDKYLASTV